MGDFNGHNEATDGNEVAFGGRNNVIGLCKIQTDIDTHNEARDDHETLFFSHNEANHENEMLTSCPEVGASVKSNCKSKTSENLHYNFMYREKMR